jgi:hypothetical protein
LIVGIRSSLFKFFICAGPLKEPDFIHTPKNSSDKFNTNSSQNQKSDLSSGQILNRMAIIQKNAFRNCFFEAYPD